MPNGSIPLWCNSVSPLIPNSNACCKIAGCSLFGHRINRFSAFATYTSLSPNLAKHSRNGVEGATPTTSLVSPHRSPFVPRARRRETANQTSNDTLQRLIHRQTGQLLHVVDCRQSGVHCGAVLGAGDTIFLTSIPVLIYDLDFHVGTFLRIATHVWVISHMPAPSPRIEQKLCRSLAPA